MALGFFGTAIALLGVAIAIPFVYALVWPGGVSRVALFLSVTNVFGIITGVAAFIWQIAPLQGIGIAGVPAGSSGDGASLNSTLLSRFYIALVVLIFVQAALSKALQHLLAP